jgi:hypothetical protein
MVENTTQSSEVENEEKTSLYDYFEIKSGYSMRQIDLDAHWEKLEITYVEKGIITVEIDRKLSGSYELEFRNTDTEYEHSKNGWALVVIDGPRSWEDDRFGFDIDEEFCDAFLNDYIYDLTLE